MKKKIISEQESKRISMLSNAEMLNESSTWSPSKWVAYLSKGKTFDDEELNRFIEEEIM